MAAGDVTFAEGTPVSLTFTSLASLADGGMAAAAKADLGAARAEFYVLTLLLPFGSAPAAGKYIRAAWANSASATAGTANDGRVSGTDASQGSTTTERGEMINQCQELGLMSLIQTSSEQVWRVLFTPRERYGMPVVRNESGQAFGAGATAVLRPLLRNIAAS